MIYPGMARVVSHRSASKPAGPRIQEIDGPQASPRAKLSRHAPLADPMQVVFASRGSKPTRNPVPSQPSQRASGYLTAPFLARGAANYPSLSPSPARNGTVFVQSRVTSPRLQQPQAERVPDQALQQPPSQQQASQQVVPQPDSQVPQQVPPQQAPPQQTPQPICPQKQLELSAVPNSSLQPQINALGAVADKFCPSELNILKVLAEALVFTGLVLLKWTVSLSKPQRITAVIKAGLVVLFFALHPVYASLTAVIVVGTYLYEKLYMRRRPV